MVCMKNSATIAGVRATTNPAVLARVVVSFIHSLSAEIPVRRVPTIVGARVIPSSAHSRATTEHYSERVSTSSVPGCTDSAFSSTRWSTGSRYGLSSALGISCGPRSTLMTFNNTRRSIINQLSESARQKRNTEFSHTSPLHPNRTHQLSK
jgi:hypothetical protein